MMRFIAVATILCCTCAEAQHFVPQTKVRVTDSTTIDWGYAVTGKSQSDTPEDLTPGYRSTAQRFDLYAPRGPVARKLPAILYISFSGNPMGWDYVGPTCVREGVVYIGPHKAGNATPLAERIRISLDCLDQVRRHYRLDPDRTYLAGYSGGGHVAARIATMLPEYFGGVIAANMVFPPPASPWHRDRLASRISVASIVGENEAAGFEMSRLHVPFLERLGIRARCHLLARRGHSAPPPETFDSAFRWLEQDTTRRSRNAENRPVLRIEASPDRETLASLALDDCKNRLEDSEQVAHCLAMLEHIRHRWPDTPASQSAADLLGDYEARDEKPWLESQRIEGLRQARFLSDAYESASRVSSGIDKVQRAGYAMTAMANLALIRRDSDDEAERDNSAKRSEALQPIADKHPLAGKLIERSTLQP